MLLFSSFESGKFISTENKYAESSRAGVNYSLLIKYKVFSGTQRNGKWDKMDNSTPFFIGQFTNR